MFTTVNANLHHLHYIQTTNFNVFIIQLELVPMHLIFVQNYIYIYCKL